MSKFPIPPVIWEKIIAFLACNKSGQIVLYVHDGRFRKCEIVESFRVDDAA